MPTGFLWDERKMRISEALRVIDDSLIEWLRKDGLTSEQQNRLREARRNVTDIESLMIVARILDAQEVEEITRARREALKKLAQE